MVIELRYYDIDVKWKMQIDLRYVADEVGKKRSWYDEHYKKHYYVPFTKNHAKKICRLIRKYGAWEDIKKADIFIQDYALTHKDNTLLEIWEKA